MRQASKPDPFRRWLKELRSLIRLAEKGKAATVADRRTRRPRISAAN